MWVHPDLCVPRPPELLCNGQSTHRCKKLYWANRAPKDLCWAQELNSKKVTLIPTLIWAFAWLWPGKQQPSVSNIMGITTRLGTCAWHYSEGYFGSPDSAAATECKMDFAQSVSQTLSASNDSTELAESRTSSISKSPVHVSSRCLRLFYMLASTKRICSTRSCDNPHRTFHPNYGGEGIHTKLNPNQTYQPASGRKQFHNPAVCMTPLLWSTFICLKYSRYNLEMNRNTYQHCWRLTWCSKALHHLNWL